MDDIDIKILRILKENSKISISEISNRVNLSVSAVGERVKKLENNKIIQKYTAILNPESFNKELMAIMLVSLGKPDYNDKFVEYVKRQEDIIECHYIAGNYDYSIKLVTSNTASLEKILNGIKSVRGVVKTTTSVVLSTVKNEYTINPSKIE